ncbi:MAG: Hpt domain-containing protein, partial [Gammaproteobacteria bacterium]|nr:Hpt domain-containing protein [Gammaproteobacteria bacterium]
CNITTPPNPSNINSLLLDDNHKQTHSSESSALECFDSIEAKKLAGGNQELAKELFEMLITELPAYEEKIRIALDDNNIKDLKYFVHKINGATSYCGVPKLRHAVSELENKIDTNDLGTLTEDTHLVLESIKELLEYQPSNTDG